jgi:site-specific DNA recombinase
MSRTTTGTPSVQPHRCAIYTRKSSDEGLDQKFNSLDAQYEVCKSFVENHSSDGWVVLPNRYDDGGYSGGTTERPGLKLLFRDIDAGLADCIVVYKIDRISRSQIDFLQMLERFKAGGVDFVSVSQPIDTTTPTGRAMLGSLMVFAQLEREMTGERIRDKIAASKKRGMWMGGVVPLGYRVVDRKLVIRDDEAATVRKIFEGFVQCGSATILAKNLAAEGATTRSGKQIDKGFIYKLLNNKLYLGLVVHKGNIYPGEHAAIISQALWDKVHAIMAESPHVRAGRVRSSTPALLKGLVFDSGGAAMSPTHTCRRGKKYRYYTSQTLLKGGLNEVEVGRIPADGLEAAVVNQLRGVFRAPEIVVATLRVGRSKSDRVDEADVRLALAQLDPMWDRLFPNEQARIVQLLVQRVDVSANGANIRIRSEGLRSLATEIGGSHRVERRRA